MSNNTTPNELTLILQTIIKPTYLNANVDNYYVVSTMLPTTPTSGTPDRLMQWMTEQILYLRNNAVGNFNVAMSDADILDFYEDIQRVFGDAIDILTDIKTLIDDKVTTYTP